MYNIYALLRKNPECVDVITFICLRDTINFNIWDEIL